MFWVADENILYTSIKEDIFSVTDEEDSIEFLIPENVTVNITKETDTGKTATLNGAGGEEVSVKYSQQVEGVDVEYSIIGRLSDQANVEMRNQEINVTGFESGKVIVATGSDKVEKEFNINSNTNIHIRQNNENDSVIEIGGRKGDLNNDSKTNIIDLMKCLHHISGRTLLDGEQLVAADINDDGKVTVVDLMRLLHYVSGRSKTL